MSIRFCMRSGSRYKLVRVRHKYRTAIGTYFRFRFRNRVDQRSICDLHVEEICMVPDGLALC